jgi:hypothetical protein
LGHDHRLDRNQHNDQPDRKPQESQREPIAR